MNPQLKFSEGLDKANEAALNTVQGFRYQPALINPAVESSLVERVRELPFREFDFHGYKGKRRIVSFGWHYEFAGGGYLNRAGGIPDFLRGLRVRAASFAGLEAEELEHVLVTEYGPGAGIGWHRDKEVFDKVVGVSLLSTCVLRFRRKLSENKVGSRGRVNAWGRANILAEPRSAYLLSGPARTEWQHSILRVDSLRYSITFRSLREAERI